jgi:hypothetical protein
MKGYRMATGAVRGEKGASSSVRGWRFVVLGLLSPVVAPFVAWIILGDSDSAGAEAAGYAFLVGGLLVGIVLVVVGVSVLLTNPKGKVELPPTEESGSRRGARGLVIAAGVMAFLLLITYAGVNAPAGLWVALAVLGVFAMLRSVRGRGQR